MEEDFVRFVFFPVGRGACTLVSVYPLLPTGPRRYAVIDSNQSDVHSVVDYLRSPWFENEHIDIDPATGRYHLHFATLTHYDWDHFNGMDILLGGPTYASVGRRIFKTNVFLYPVVPPAAVARRKYSPAGVQYRQLTEIDNLVFEPLRRTRKNGDHPLPRVLAFDATYESLFSPPGTLRDSELTVRALAPSAHAVSEMKEWRSLEDVTSANLVSGALRIQYGKSRL